MSLEILLEQTETNTTKIGRPQRLPWLRSKTNYSIWGLWIGPYSCPPKGGAGAEVEVGMLKGGGIPFIENEKVCWFFGFLVSWFFCFLVSWFQSCLVYWFIGLLVFWFLCVLLFGFLGLLVSKLKFPKFSKFYKLENSLNVLGGKYWSHITWFQFYLFRRYWSHPQEFQDFIKRAVGNFRRPSFPQFSKC